MSGTYVWLGNYLILCLILLTEEETKPIGVQDRNTNAFCKDMKKRFTLQLVIEFADKENVIEELKAINHMFQIQKMNNICSKAIESVNTELIFN